jgi:hypothetical protein
MLNIFLPERGYQISALRQKPQRSGIVDAAHDNGVI